MKYEDKSKDELISTIERLEKELSRLNVKIESDDFDHTLTEIKLQKSELLYLSILNSSPDPIAITDLNGIVMFSSPMASKKFGYSNKDEFNNRSIFDFLAPEYHEKAKMEIELMHN